jgi:hypothetical protein
VLDRALSLAGDSRPDGEAERLRSLRRFLLLYGAARSWMWLRFLDSPVATVDPDWIAGSALLLTGCAVAGFVPRWERTAAVAALPVLLIQLCVTFPFADNHFFVELMSLAIVCLAVDRADDAWVVAGVRWLCVIVLFWTGLQKAFYGHYWHGDYLAFMAGTDDRFATLLGPILGQDVLGTLQGFDPLGTDAGPYRVASWPLRLGSNAVVLGELGLPWLLMHPRTRRFAAVAALMLVLTIQSGAREVGFALLFTNLLLIFLPSNWNGRLLPLYGSILALGLLLAALGSSWLPPGSL